MPRFIARLLLATALSCSLPARASDPDLPDKLFEEGKALMNQQRVAEACPKLAQSQELDPSPGTLLALAHCRELLGMLASAHRAYLDAAALAEAATQQDEISASRVVYARDAAAALQKRISTLTLMIPDDLSKLDGFELKLNSVQVDRSTWGATLQLDQGFYTIDVSAPGYRPWRTSIMLRDEGERQIVNLPALDKVQTQPPTAVGRTPAKVAPRVPARLPSKAQRAPQIKTRNLQLLSLTTGVGSIVSLGIASTFGLRAISKNNQSNADGHCDERGCDDRGMNLKNEAISAARLSTIFFIAGGGLGAASVTLYLSADGGARGAVGVAVVQPSRPPALTISGSF